MLGLRKFYTQNKITVGYIVLFPLLFVLSGVYAVINTSFNLKGEPIVNSPQEAVNTFLKSEMDMLVLGNSIIKK